MSAAQKLEQFEMNPSNPMPLLVMAAGGTGGHMFPAQALAEEMLRRGWRVKLTTDPRGARYTGQFPKQVEIEVLSSATFARGGILSKALVPFKIFAGVLGAVRAFFKERPDVVIGFGGYPSIPAVAAATLLRLPRALHEQNGVLGRVNQIFVKRVSLLAWGTEPSEYPQGVRSMHVGNPVRSAVFARAGAAYMPPGDYPLSLLIFGGSQGAQILSKVLPEAIAALPARLRARLRIAQQAREADIDALNAEYDRLGVSAELRPFFHDMARRISEAQLVICRAGASSVADLTVIGRPAILVPLAASLRQEQHANAAAMVNAGAAIMIEEHEFSSKALAKRIEEFLTDPNRMAQMAQKALEIGKPDAHHKLADLVEEIADRQQRVAATH